MGSSKQNWQAELQKEWQALAVSPVPPCTPFSSPSRFRTVSFDSTNFFGSFLMMSPCSASGGNPVAKSQAS